MNDMTQPSSAALLTAVRVSGNDRFEFLQGQFTQDLRLLTPENPLLAGWNSPKGRLLCVSWLADWQAAVWFAVPTALADAIARRLKMFVLRADARVELSDLPVHLIADKYTQERSARYCNYDDNYFLLGGPGGWQLGGRANDPDAAITAEQWRQANIRAGLPVIWPETSEAFVPQMVNLDLLNAISFAKGCYVGQEIVARTQNLGRIKRRMLRFGCDARSAKPGDTVMADGSNAGTVVDAAGSEVLAVIKLDKLTAELSINDAPLQAAALPYAVPETD